MLRRDAGERITAVRDPTTRADWKTSGALKTMFQSSLDLDKRKELDRNKGVRIVLGMSMTIECIRSYFYVQGKMISTETLRLVSEAWKPRLVSADSESKFTAVSGRTPKEGHGLSPHIDRLRLGKVRSPRWDSVYAGQRSRIFCGDLDERLVPESDGIANQLSVVVYASATPTYPNTATLERSDCRMEPSSRIKRPSAENKGPS
ncbi:hypothetical protein B0H14DRAFT_2559128 [Mycena olivaceomarginata]|nr:hypothetical protein B0H14DRAFT_2559128 [Mycena olivaceomarginata]